MLRVWFGLFRVCEPGAGYLKRVSPANDESILSCGEYEMCSRTERNEASRLLINFC